MIDVTGRIDDGISVLAAQDTAETIDVNATVAVSGFGSVGYPKAIPEALADDPRELELTIVSGGGVGAEIDSLLVEAGAIARRYPFQVRPESRTAINSGEVAFHDRHIARLGDEVAFGGLVDVDVAIVEAVAVGHDWLIPTTSVGQTPAFIETAPRVLVEVNDAQPRTLERLHDVYRPARPPAREPIPLSEPDERIGSPRIPFDPDQLVGVVRTERPDTTYTFAETSPTHRDLAANLASFLDRLVEDAPVFEDRICLQFGVGSIGNALVGEMHSLDLGDREVVYFGEVIQDGVLDALDAGVFSSASATSLALSEAGQTRLFDGIDEYANQIVVRPADVSNGPALIDRFGVVAINSAVEVDLYGHANSTHIGGRNVVNGIGGSGDFTRNALVGVIAIPSTAAGGDISRIVPLASHVDHTEHDVDVVVTEQGIADCRGCSPRERAKAVIDSCAHPDFREPLRTYFERASRGGGNIPHDLSRAFAWEDDEPGE